MVLQNRLEYGFSGDQVPAMPQFPTSAKVISKFNQFLCMLIVVFQIV